jgi:hypothetical protein
MLIAILKLVEKRIKEAEEQGAFDNLPGKYKPLKLEDNTNVPDDLRLAYKILKNAGYLPQELQLRKEIKRMEDLLEHVSDEKEAYKLVKEINLKIMKLNMMGKKSPLLEENQIYYKKVLQKIKERREKRNDR